MEVKNVTTLNFPKKIESASPGNMKAEISIPLEQLSEKKKMKKLQKKCLRTALTE